MAESAVLTPVSVAVLGTAPPPPPTHPHTADASVQSNVIPYNAIPNIRTFKTFNHDSMDYERLPLWDYGSKL